MMIMIIIILYNYDDCRKGNFNQQIINYLLEIKIKKEFMFQKRLLCLQT